MSKGKFIILAALLAFAVPAAYAWPACSGNWIAVPTGTSSANGAVVVEGGQTWQCQPKTTTNPTNTNSNTNSNTNKNDQSQNQGQSQGQQQVANGGSARSSSKATGGTSQVLGSGNSSSNSSVGPISSTNTNTATSSNNSSGNTTSISESSTYTESKIPVNTAYAAAPYPTAQCFKGGGIGGQTGVFGFSINGGKIDENCARLETARSFDAVGEYFAGCKVKVNNKYAKEAGVKLEDCLNRYVAPQPVVQVPQPPQAPTPIIVNLPAPVVNVTPTPVYIDQAPTYVPQPVYKAPRKKLNKPIGTLRPCPVTPGHNAKANCFEDD